MKQLSPIDMTGVLCTNVSVLRTGLLSVKGMLETVRESEEIGVLKDAMVRSLEIIEKTLVEDQEAEEKGSVNS